MNIARVLTRARELDYLSDVTAEACGRAFTLKAATKDNWFNLNHHTGQGAPTHFILIHQVSSEL